MRGEQTRNGNPDRANVVPPLGRRSNDQMATFSPTKSVREHDVRSLSVSDLIPAIPKPGDSSRQCLVRMLGNSVIDDQNICIPDGPKLALHRQVPRDLILDGVKERVWNRWHGCSQNSPRAAGRNRAADG